VEIATVGRLERVEGLEVGHRAPSRRRNGARSGAADRVNGGGRTRTPRVEQVLRATGAALEEVTADERIARRLRLVPTSFQIVVGRRRTVDCRLDRDPIEIDVDRPDFEAQVRLYLTTRQLHEFWLGSFSPALGILGGEARYQGPVRHLLRILPILATGRDRYLESLGR